MLKGWSSGVGYVTFETRDHNAANELVERDVISHNLDFIYDKAGNIRTQELPAGGFSTTTITYTHDAWNRLVKIEYGNDDRAEYRYNGLNWRVVKLADTSVPPDGTLNQQRVMYYSANWQLLEERIDDDTDAHTPDGDDRKMQYVWGPRYIDDIVARRETSLGDPGMETWYHLTDAQFSTVAIITDDTAEIVERISYDAYGKARHHRLADLDGDGATTSTDATIRHNNAGNYGVGDLNRDGIVDNDDRSILNADLGAAIADGLLSGSGGTDNIIGYCGYIFNAESPGADSGYLYTVRHRHYEPGLGRWLERDPLGYVDGMGLYEYVAGSPISQADPTGQSIKCVICRVLIAAILGGGCSKLGAAHCFKFKHPAAIAACLAIKGILCAALGELIGAPHLLCELLGFCPPPEPATPKKEPTYGWELIPNPNYDPHFPVVDPCDPNWPIRKRLIPVPRKEPREPIIPPGPRPVQPHDYDPFILPDSM